MDHTNGTVDDSLSADLGARNPAISLADSTVQSRSAEQDLGTIDVLAELNQCIRDAVCFGTRSNSLGHSGLDLAHLLKQFHLDLVSDGLDDLVSGLGNDVIVVTGKKSLIGELNSQTDLGNLDFLCCLGNLLDRNIRTFGNVLCLTYELVVGHCNLGAGSADKGVILSCKRSKTDSVDVLLLDIVCNYLGIEQVCQSCSICICRHIKILSTA